MAHRLFPLCEQILARATGQGVILVPEKSEDLPLQEGGESLQPVGRGLGGLVADFVSLMVYNLVPDVIPQQHA